MKIIKPSIEILDILDQTIILKRLELIGRTCYKSEDKITEFSCVDERNSKYDIDRILRKITSNF